MVSLATRTIFVALGLLVSLSFPADPSPGSSREDYEWVRAVPPRQGNWPRWVKPVVG